MAIDENYNDSVVKPVDDGKDVEETYKEYAEKVEFEKKDICSEWWFYRQARWYWKIVKETADSVESIWGGWKYGEDWTCWNNCRKWNFGW